MSSVGLRRDRDDQTSDNPVGCVNSVPAAKSVGRERLTRLFSPETRASTVRSALARSLSDAKFLSLSIGGDSEAIASRGSSERA
jgi:hypothetical protein